MPAPRPLSVKKRLDAVFASMPSGYGHADFLIPMPREMLPGRCARCRHRGYKVAQHPVNGRPWFKCGQCENEWTCGNDGGEYLTEAGRRAFAGAKNERT